VKESRAILIRGSELRVEESDSSFSRLLRQHEDRVRRDVFILFASEATDSGRLYAGYTIVYPHCSTRGHAHADREEVYYVVRGRGIMQVDGQEIEVSAGDTLYVRPGPRHTTRNPNDLPLEFFWITCNVQ